MTAQGHFERFASTIDEIKDTFFIKGLNKRHSISVSRLKTGHDDKLTVKGIKSSFA